MNYPNEIDQQVASEQDCDSKLAVRYSDSFEVNWNCQYQKLQNSQDLKTFWILSKGPKKLLSPPPVPSRIKLTWNNLLIHLWSTNDDPQI